MDRTEDDVTPQQAVSCEFIALGYIDRDGRWGRRTVPFAFLLTTPTMVFGCKIRDVTGEMNLSPELGSAVDCSVERLMNSLCADDRPNDSDAQIVADETCGFSPVKVIRAEAFEVSDDDFEARKLQEQSKLQSSFMQDWSEKGENVQAILREWATNGATDVKKIRRELAHAAA